MGDEGLEVGGNGETVWAFLITFSCYLRAKTGDEDLVAGGFAANDAKKGEPMRVFSIVFFIALSTPGDVRGGRGEDDVHTWEPVGAFSIASWRYDRTTGRGDGEIDRGFTSCTVGEFWRAFPTMLANVLHIVGLEGESSRGEMIGWGGEKMSSRCVLPGDDRADISAGSVREERASGSVWDWISREVTGETLDSSHDECHGRAEFSAEGFWEGEVVGGVETAELTEDDEANGKEDVDFRGMTKPKV